jgi:hypothetical protein
VKRTRYNAPLSLNYQIVTEILNRQGLGRRMGFQYGDKRRVYKALGYPDENDLTFEYYYNKYDRQDIAKAVIDRPCDATWRGKIHIKEEGKSISESEFNKQWKILNRKLNLKNRLNKVDKLCELGRYSILLLGLDDVKKIEDFKNPVAGGTRKLLYVKQVAETEAMVQKWETNPKDPRYGMPVIYQISSGTIQNSTGVTTTAIQEYKTILVHHSRVLHYVTGNLTSEIYGVSKLKPIINRLVDLEKLLGGDAEMYWRGARPGYTATAKEDYEMGTEEEENFQAELDKYEHDLRRFILSKGMDIKALETQISDPSAHVDTQLQAISAQTGIPKRILIGSERGELASSQDRDQWKELILTRQEEHAEPTILRPFIDRLIEYKVLPDLGEYTIVWGDAFAPSDADKAKIGKDRAGALKDYVDSPVASIVMPPGHALKHLLGLSDELVEEIVKEVGDLYGEENKILEYAEQEQIREDKANKVRRSVPVSE